MRTVAILNSKGGTGKTTTTVNLGHALAFLGQSTLVVDCDPQASLTAWLGVAPTKTLTHVMLGKEPPAACIMEARERLHAIPGDEQLARVEVFLARNGAPQTALEQRLAGLPAYDFVLLDCPPSTSLLNLNALSYAEEVFIPASMDYLSMQGITRILRRVVDGSKVTRIIPTFYNHQTRKCREILGDLQKVFKSRVASPIRVNVRLAEAASFHKTIFEYDLKSRGAHDYWQLAREVLGVKEAHGGDIGRHIAPDSGTRGPANG